MTDPVVPTTPVTPASQPSTSVAPATPAVAAPATGMTLSTAVPSFMKSYTGETGAEGLAKHQKIKFVKVLQPMSQATINSRPDLNLQVGDVIVGSGPELRVLFRKNEKRLIIPIFSWEEYLEQYDNDTQSPNGNPTRARSLDPSSELAQRVKDQKNFKKTFECDKMRKKDGSGPGTYKLMAALNFAILVLDPVTGRSERFCVSFKGGEYRYGKGWAGRISQQSEQGVPMFGLVFETSVNTQHQNQAKTQTWPGLDFGGHGYVQDEETLNRNAEIYKAVKKVFAEGFGESDYSDDEGAATESHSEAAEHTKF